MHLSNLDKLVEVLALKEFGNAVLQVGWAGLQEVIVIKGKGFALRVVKPTRSSVVSHYCYQRHAELRGGFIKHRCQVEYGIRSEWPH
jgi:hypothetical protein